MTRVAMVFESVVDLVAPSPMPEEAHRTVQAVQMTTPTNLDASMPSMAIMKRRSSLTMPAQAASLRERGLRKVGMLQRTAALETSALRNRSTMDEHHDLVTCQRNEQRDILRKASARSSAKEQEAAEAAQSALAIQQEMHRTFPGPQRAVGGIGVHTAGATSASSLTTNGSLISVGFDSLSKMSSFTSLTHSNSQLTMGLPSARSICLQSSPRSDGSYVASVGKEARQQGHTLLHVAGLLGLEGGGGSVGKLELKTKGGLPQKPRPMDHGLPQEHPLSNPAAAIADVIGNSRGGMDLRLKAMEMSISRNAAQLDMHRVHLDDLTVHPRSMQATFRTNRTPMGIVGEN